MGDLMYTNQSLEIKTLKIRTNGMVAKKRLLLQIAASSQKLDHHLSKIEI